MTAFRRMGRASGWLARQHEPGEVAMGAIGLCGVQFHLNLVATPELPTPGGATPHTHPGAGRRCVVPEAVLF